MTERLRDWHWRMRRRWRGESGRIAVIPGKLSGAPHIAGTRVPVASIKAMWGYGDTEAAIAYLWPYLTREDIRAAIAYEGRA